MPIHSCLHDILKMIYCLTLQEAPKYTKKVLKKGNKINYPMKGDVVSCLYTGKLQDGTVFDSNEDGHGGSIL